MKLKPYKQGYLQIVGNGKVRYLDEDDLKLLSMAYDELRFVSEEHRKSFGLSD